MKYGCYDKGHELFVYVKDQQLSFIKELVAVNSKCLFCTSHNHGSPPVTAIEQVKVNCVRRVCQAACVCKYVSCRSAEWDCEYVQLCQKR